VEKLQENIKKIGKNNFNGTPKPISIGFLPKQSTKLKGSFGRKISV
jgi:hypothetical protein